MTGPVNNPDFNDPGYLAFDSTLAKKNNCGAGTSASAGTNINALVTAICPISLTLLGGRPVLFNWAGGALANVSGISQNIQMQPFVAGASQGIALACFGNTPTIPNGSVLQLSCASWLFPAGFGAGATQFDMRFTVGDGSPSISFRGNSFSSPGYLSVIEF